MVKHSFQDLQAWWPNMIETEISGDQSEWRRLLHKSSEERWFVYFQKENAGGTMIREIYEMQGEKELADWKTISLNFRPENSSENHKPVDQEQAVGRQHLEPEEIHPLSEKQEHAA